MVSKKPDQTQKPSIKGTQNPVLRNERSQGGKRSAMDEGQDSKIILEDELYAREPHSSEQFLKEQQADYSALRAEDLDQESRLAQGVAVIRNQVKTLTTQPGVYRMLNAQGEPLYIGKAKNLRRRVYSYTQLNKQPQRLLRMISQTVAMEFITTHTEVEALLLESNLIKRFMPPFNVLLRDDKSFPYIHIRDNHSFAQLRKHRGAHNMPGHYHGPFANGHAVNRTLTALEKAFQLRSCSDTVFAQRQRPCLLYQIKRCSAPCVDKISPQDYQSLVDDAMEFLTGKSSQIQQRLAEQMEQAAQDLAFERAAKLRDRIRALSEIQASQDINVHGLLDDADVIALHQDQGQSCIQIFFFRSGRNYGNHSYFPKHDSSLDAQAVLASFIGQFYAEKPVPKLVLISHQLDEQALIAQALRQKAQAAQAQMAQEDYPQKKSSYTVELSAPQRGEKRKLIEQALRNAREALERKRAQSMATGKIFTRIAEIFELEEPINRIEVYDNSHLQGKSALGAMIVAGAEGFIKNSYRRFNIKSADSQDDYAMMHEVLTRRFLRANQEDPERTKGQWPDLVLIDGGKGQLSVALSVLNELGIEDLAIAAISKGPERDAGREEIHRPNRPVLRLAPNDPTLFYLQRLRDEAHNFAITGHRQKRAKSLVKSKIDGIPQIGPKRKKALLMHFGSAKAVEGAGLKDLQLVEGINAKTAQIIYDYFHLN